MKRQRPVYRNLKSLNEAREIFLSRFQHTITEPETVPVRQALNRVLTGPVKAARSVPAYHAAAMDGIAVRAVSTFGALPENPVSLSAGDAVAVNTGDPLPANSDSVVMIEKIEAAGSEIEVREAVYPWQNVRKAGEDIVAGEILLPARHRIRSFDQGALLAAGILSVEVFRRPRVLIIPTGDEILAAEEALDPLPAGAIVEVNGQVLSSMAAECDADPVLAVTVPDDPAQIRGVLESGLSGGYDAILIIAGSSLGTEDFTPSLLGEMGTLLVHGITVMPGKPTLLAEVAGRPVIGVPGYPVSAVVAFREFVRPLLCRMQGLAQQAEERVEAVMGRKLPSRPGLEEHVRVILGKVGERTVAVPLAGGAGMLTSLVRADGILRIPEDVTGYSEGDRVVVELLTPAESLENRLIALGSHDLTIDLLASLLRDRSQGRITISSSNVGSLGGLLAIGKGIAHFAGSHLLDTVSGDYNHAYIRRFLPHTPVVLVTLVYRWQGFMIAKGNPKSLQGITDLVRSDISFVNRQPGSGTRILLDHELQKAGLDPAAVLGYLNQEYTHMSVALAVASGRADTGLGVMAAARALNLDFVPLTRERYDLVIPADMLEDARIRMLLEIIRSSAFKQQVAAMGGYEVAETGTLNSVQP